MSDRRALVVIGQPLAEPSASVLHGADEALLVTVDTSLEVYSAKAGRVQQDGTQELFLADSRSTFSSLVPDHVGEEGHVPIRPISTDVDDGA
jgi:hypothetical protein